VELQVKKNNEKELKLKMLDYSTLIMVSGHSLKMPTKYWQNFICIHAH